jgi:hypothetical protein
MKKVKYEFGLILYFLGFIFFGLGVLFLKDTTEYFTPKTVGTFSFFEYLVMGLLLIITGTVVIICGLLIRKINSDNNG